MRRVVVGLMVALGPFAGGAQVVPRAMFEVAAGAGPTGERAGEAWFYNELTGAGRVGVAVRTTTGKRFASVVRFDYSTRNMDWGGRAAVCLLAPNATCRGEFPDADGPWVGAGVVAWATSRLLVGGGGGFFRSTNSWYLSANGSFEVVKHLGLLAEWRYLNMDYAGGRATYRPIQFGLRAY